MYEYQKKKSGMREKHSGKCKIKNYAKTTLLEPVYKLLKCRPFSHIFFFENKNLIQ